MKKQVERSVTLVAFRSDLAALESLAEGVLSTLSGERKRASISLEFGDETHEFDSFEELRGVTPPAGRPDGFRLWVSDREFESRFILHATGNRPSVHATGSNAAWCAGVIALAQDFAKRNRTWYSRVPVWALFVVFLLLGFLPLLLRALIGRDPIEGWLLVPWVSLQLFLVALFFVGNKLFPPATLLLHSAPGMLTRRQAEIVAIGAVVSAIAAILAVFVAWLK